MFGEAINQTSGSLTSISGSPFATQTLPLSISVTRSGKYAYVANYNSNSVSGVKVQSNGTLTPLSPSSFSVGTNPQGVITTAVPH